MALIDYILAVLPLIPSLLMLLQIHDTTVLKSITISIALTCVGFFLSNSLIPVVGGYTLKRGLCGKDLGKKGSATENNDIPEALGIVTGTTFLMISIFSQLLFATSFQQQMVYNSALFSICFMIFLGFTDDTLELKWRYKLILPTIASFPLLTAYSGSTAIYIPQKLQSLLMSNYHLTDFGEFLSYFVIVDSQANGAIVELGYFFYIYMSLLSVFCTNAINIYAGINGLEAGQSYIIAASVLFFKLYELSQGINNENQMFTIIMVLPFLGVILSLLQSNWYPANVFVGDTFCYFAGMTFAVLGIHGHFSKTLLLLFLPQIVNFIYSIPQLFKLIPCPRHRLPRINIDTKLMSYSAFPCQSHEYRWFKVKKDDTEVPNCTLICLVLRLAGPLHEKSLCIVLLSLQVLTTCLIFFIRYYVFENI